MDYGPHKKGGEKERGPSDVEPCVLALHRGSAGPALAPLPMKRCSFFPQALALAFYFYIYLSYVFRFLVVVVVVVCCYGRSLCFSLMPKQEPRNKNRLSRFCLLCDLIVGCFVFCSLRTSLLLHRVTQV